MERIYMDHVAGTPLLPEALTAMLPYYKERFGHKKGMYPVAEEIGSRTISLPLYPKLSDEEVSYVIDMVLESIKEA